MSAYTCRTPYPGGTCGCGCGCESNTGAPGDGTCPCRECRPLTLGQLEALRVVAWGTQHFGGALTGGSNLTRRRALRLVALGLAKSEGLVEQCDADGWTIAGRSEREGFSLTDAGRAVLTAQEDR